MGMGRSHSIFEILSAIFHRVFVGQPSTFYWYQLFVEENGFFYGSSFPNPGGIFPFEYRQASVEISRFAYGGVKVDGVVGSMPSIFFGVWYINFGKPLAIFSMFLLGFILQSIDILFIHKLVKNKSLLFSAFYLFMIIFLSRYVGTSYVGILFEEKLLFIFILIVIIVMIRKITSYIKINN